MNENILKELIEKACVIRDAGHKSFIDFMTNKTIDGEKVDDIEYATLIVLISPMFTGYDKDVILSAMITKMTPVIE